MRSTALVFFFLLSLNIVEQQIYLIHTRDGPSIEFYDCILVGAMHYCRRPDYPIDLNRSQESLSCEMNGGTIHFFEDLISKKINVSTILYEWKSSVDQVEDFSRYQENPSEATNQSLCRCHRQQTFGKYCEYQLPMGETFKDTLDWQVKMKNENPWQVQIHGNMTCYKGIDCNSGLLCLDWREICDSVQNCMDDLDEEQCDLLELNVCENNEYRCVNGMCIPEEYFLDGRPDCLDWSDEMDIKSSDECARESASEICDDHTCLINRWSCGDGQCIENRFAFQKRTDTTSCIHRRDQYFLCETHSRTLQWTMPNGRCYGEKQYESLPMTNPTEVEKCEYLLKCALSEGNEKNCPCEQKTAKCTEILSQNCSLPIIKYPRDAFPSPNLHIYFNKTRNWTYLLPNFLQLNGTIKCHGRLIPITSSISLEDYSKYKYRPEKFFCQRTRNSPDVHNVDNFASHSCMHSNESTQICQQWNPCMSVTRINDGSIDCFNREDETNLSISDIVKTCRHVMRHRFRCSVDQPTCLTVMALGDGNQDCQNHHDESMQGSTRRLSQIYCNQRRNSECSLLRQNIARSWSLNQIEHISFEEHIPFRSYCDTFTNLGSSEDENLLKCHAGWVCTDNQWRCRDGQCVNQTWVGDGEWDCVDGSDEEVWFTNLTSWIRQQLLVDYRKDPSAILWDSCTENGSFICLSPFPKNQQFQCLNFSQLGDGKIDCLGAIDERNKLIVNGKSSSLLGNNFLCSSTNTTIPYYRHCINTDRCTNPIDDEQWCRWFNQSALQCATSSDFICFNQQCIRRARCNQKFECPLGEDEYMCDYASEKAFMVQAYRREKERLIRMMEQSIRLPIYPNSTSGMVSITSSTSVRASVIIPTKLSTPYSCNRGVGLLLSNNHSTVCFCPPQYYGNFCQYHADRLSLLLHLNLSQSMFTPKSDPTIVIKLLVLFLFEDKVLMTHDFHVRASKEIFTFTKKMVYFPYSRSSFFRHHRIQRYMNRSNIIHKQPYLIRIEAYVKHDDMSSLRLIAVWQYPILFDYLPVYLFSKALHLVKLNPYSDPCQSNPCPFNAHCQRLMNNNTEYICLCNSNFTGKNCSIEDQQCTTGYCASLALCKPNYRRLLRGNSTPYCICPFNRFGDRCDIVHKYCEIKPCFNNGSCFPTAQADRTSCLCTDDSYGSRCEFKKSRVHLSIVDTLSYVGAVVQYFDLDFIALELNIVQQQIFSRLPPIITYLHDKKTVPEIMIARIYRTHDQLLPDLYLLSVRINATSINETTHMSDFNRCQHLQQLNDQRLFTSASVSSPIEYHQICNNNRVSLCFRDDTYLCICAVNHTRVECFRYDDKLDRCSFCLAKGRCLREGNDLSNTKFICLCPICYFGDRCQFNSKSFAFSLNQLLHKDLTSKDKKYVRTIYILFVVLSFIVGMPNNLFSFVTLRRRECLSTGVGHYLLCLSIANQIMIGLFGARLLHMMSIASDASSNSSIQDILCKILGFSSTSAVRISCWLASFVALERLYTTLFFTKQWFKQPHIARRLIVIMVGVILISTSYELVFTKTFRGIQNRIGTICISEYPIGYQTLWTIVDQIVSITHFFVPLFINLCCTGIIISIIIRNKRNLYRHRTPKQNDIGIPRRTGLRNVLNENKEIIATPAITLIPSSFSIFSIPLTILAFTLKCHNFEESFLRYLLITFSSIILIPSMITFILYIYPSSFYWKQWQSTNIGRRITSLRNHQSNTDRAVLSTTVKT